jgi:uncharacterized protein (TIGR02145 family)
MNRLLFLLLNAFIYATMFGQGGPGSVILPGNATCDSQYISISDCDGLTTITYNGYTYDLVEIGGQCWFKENLRTTKYKDGTPISFPGIDNSAWSSNTNGAYAWNNNDSTAFDSIYGKLYNWYAVDNSAGLCPSGWHVPTDCEWMYLEDTLGMSTAYQESQGWRGIDEGGKLKEIGTTYWNSPNTGATNSSGFTCLPGGSRDYNGNYNNVGCYGGWWSSSQTSTDPAFYRSPACNSSKIYRIFNYKEYGFSVRCIKDSGSVQTSLKKIESISPLDIYPNPTNNEITVNIKNYKGFVNIDIYDLSGRLLKSTSLTTVSLNDYAEGIYLFKVAYGNKIEEIKVIKK